MQSRIWFVHQPNDVTESLGLALNDDFDVRSPATFITVWRDVLAGYPGLALIDIPGPGWPSEREVNAVGALQRLVPVVLLIEDPLLARSAGAELGAANILFRACGDAPGVRQALRALANGRPAVHSMPSLRGAF